MVYVHIPATVITVAPHALKWSRAVRDLGYVDASLLRDGIISTSLHGKRKE